MRALPVAILGLVCLTGCVGSDPNAALRGVGPAGLATGPMPIAPVAAIESGVAPIGPMPGDLLIAPAHVVGGTDPIAILARSETTSSHTWVARAAPSEPTTRRLAPVLGTALSAHAAAPALPARTAPLLAAHLDPAEVPTTRTAERGVPPAAGGAALNEIEARAAAEQRLQAVRDRRFDAAVRRATKLVCSGCTAGPASAANQRVRRAQAVTPEGEAGAE